MMQYVNPATGGPVMKTLGAHIQLLRARRAHQGAPSHRLDRLHRRQGQRHIRSSPASATTGSKNDIFVVPSWAWHEHANASEREDAVLFSFSDLPSMQALGLYREEALADNDGHQKLAH